MLAHLAQAVGAFAADRVLDEEGTIGLDAAAELDGGSRIQAGVHVHQDLYVLAQFAAHGGDLLDAVAHRAGRLQQLLSGGIHQSPAHELETGALGFFAAFEQVVDIQGVAVVRVADYPIAHAAAQKLVDRYVQGLAQNVPQGNINGTHSGALDAAAGEKAAPVHHLPQMLDAAGILAHQNGCHHV